MKNSVCTTLGKAAAVEGSQSYERQPAPLRRVEGFVHAGQRFVLKDAAICGAASANPQQGRISCDGRHVPSPSPVSLATTDRACVEDLHVVGVGYL